MADKHPDYDKHFQNWHNSLGSDTPQEILHEKTMAQIAHQEKAHGNPASLPGEAVIVNAPLPEVKVVEHPHHIPLQWAIAVLLLLILLVITAPLGHCQFSHISTIQTKSAGSGIGLHASPFVLDCEMFPCADDGYTVTAGTASGNLSTSGTITAGSFNTSGCSAPDGQCGLFPLWYSVYMVGGQTTTCSNTTGNTNGYGFTWPVNGTYGHIWVNIATADNTAGHNYEFAILQPTASRADFSILAHTTAGPTGAATGVVSYALNQNVTLVAGQEYIIACSINTGNTATFYIPFYTFQTFSATILSASQFPTSGYTVPTLAYASSPANDGSGKNIDFGLTP